MNTSGSKPLVLTLGICLVALTAAAADGPAETALPPAPALELALDLELEPNTSSDVGQCDQPVAGALFAKSGGQTYPAVCTADCYPHTDVTCSTSGTCVAVDRNCPSQRGYVTCNGVTTFCPVCPGTVCNEGDIRFVKTGNCCDCGIGERIRQKCVNGQWVYDGTFCFPDSGLCPWCP